MYANNVSHNIQQYASHPLIVMATSWRWCCLRRLVHQCFRLSAAVQV